MLTSKSKHIHSFNLLRLLLVLTVWVHHGWLGGNFRFEGCPPWSRNLTGFFQNHGLGELAVRAFFVISGFVITRVALADKVEGKGLKYFWSKRFARIAPPMAICLFCAAVVMPRILTALQPVISKGIFASKYDTLFASTHINWRVLPYYNQWLAVNLAGRNNFFTTVLWSLIVEEQFYLAWPIFLFTVKSRQTLEKIAFCGVIAGILSMFYYTGRLHFLGKICPWFAETAPFGLVMGTLPNVLMLSVGVLIALREKQVREQRWGYFALVLLAAVGVGLFQYHALTSPGYLGQAASAVALVLFFLCVLEPLIQGRPFAFLRTKSMASIGAMTYGLYVYHMLVFSLVNNLSIWTWRRAIITSSLIALFTCLSYRLVELPFMALVKRQTSRRFSPKPQTVLT